MTINSETRVAGPFEGNDSTVAFPFAFKVFDSDEVLVVRATDAIETVLTLGADYSVTLNPDQNASPGGIVTLLLGALATGSTLTLTSDLEFLQPLDLTNQGGFYPRVINNAFDRVTILLQQLNAIVGRTLKFPLSDGPVGDLPGRAARAGTVLAFDVATGEPIAGPDIGQLGTVAAGIAAIGTVASNIADVNTVADNIADVNAVGQNIANVNIVVSNIADVNTVASNIADVNAVADNLADLSNFSGVYYGPSATDPTTRRDGSPLQVGDLYFNTFLNALRQYNGAAWVGSVNGAVTVQNLSGDGVETEFLLNYAPESEIITQVYISGVYQQKNTYSLGGVGGATLIFDEAPPAGTDNIEIVVSSLTPSDDALREDLANSADSTEGAGLVGYKRTPLSEVANTVGRMLDASAATPWEYANLVTVRPTPGDPSTWDWTAALNALFSQNRNVFLPPGNYRITASVFIPSNTTVRGTRASKIFMSTNPDGHNLVCVKDSENVTIQGFSIVGVDGAGTSFPTPGVVDGQGVCFIAYGSKNIACLDMYSAHNGNGSGNFYFATSRDCRVIGCYVELTVNAYCVDNYYDAPPGAPCPSHSSNIIISGNTARDCDRGIAIDCADSPEADNNFVVAGNTVDGAAWAGIQVNAFGALVSDNTVKGRRDLGRTVMGGQQSLPTYYGFLSDIGGSKVSVVNNKFLEIYKSAIRVTRNTDFEASGNLCHLATSYHNQNNGNLLTLIANDANSETYNAIYALADPDTPRGLGKLVIRDNRIQSDRVHPTLADAPVVIAVFNNTSNSTFLNATAVDIQGNDLRAVVDANYYIQYFNLATGRNVDVSIDRNKIRTSSAFARGIAVGIARSVTLRGNDVEGVQQGVEVTRAVNVHMKGNTWANIPVAIRLVVANTSAQIDSFVCADDFVGITEWCFSAPQPNGSAVTASDASRCNFVSCPLSAIKNAAFPRNLRGLYAGAAPTAGFWEVRDRVGVSVPTTWAEWICTVGGTPGTWKLVSQISG